MLNRRSSEAERVAAGFIPAAITPAQLHAPYDAVQAVQRRAQARVHRVLAMIERDRSARSL